jgi:hypothetical protein
MTSVQQVLDRVRSQIGVTGHPSGSNRTPCRRLVRHPGAALVRRLRQPVQLP